MGISGGPNIIGDENLVFIYDTGDSNSYKGEPTTNAIPTATINALPTYGNAWGTYNTNQYNGNTYFSIGTISSVTNNVVTTATSHPLRTHDVVTPQTTGGGVSAGGYYFVKKISNTEFSLHEYNSSQDGSQGYTNPSTGYPVVWNSIALDQKLSINASSFPTMWWGPPHLPNSGIIKEIVPNGYDTENPRIKTDCIRLNWIRPDGVTDGMAYGVDPFVTIGSPVTVSFYARAVTPSAVGKYISFQNYNYGGPAGYGYTGMTVTWGAVGQWVRNSYTFTPTHNYLISYWFPSAGNMIVDIANIQVEQKSHVTQFTTGTRSATNSLLDISSNANSISMANVSFDSNAQATFDGTDDYINANITLGPSCTLELVMQSSNYNVKIPISLDSDNYGSGPNIFFYNNVINWNTGDSGANFFTNSSYPNSNYHHIVVSNTNGVSAILYIDGVQIGTANPLNTTTTGANKLWIGRFHGDNNYTVAGNIPIVRIYNRALSASEVRQNYNQLKSRFNI
jgi:hypothetical protein